MKALGFQNPTEKNSRYNYQFTEKHVKLYRGNIISKNKTGKFYKINGPVSSTNISQGKRDGAGEVTYRLKETSRNINQLQYLKLDSNKL